VTPHSFPSARAFGEWLDEHHASAREVWVGFWKVGSGEPSLTWPQSVDEALRYGWIDGVRRRVDERRYAIRFTPRQPGSHWSAVNLKKVQALIEAGRMHPAGLAAHTTRDARRTGDYSFERAHAALSPDEERRFHAAPAAWSWFESQPPGYRRVALHWVTSPKRAEARARRLATLIEDAAAGRRIALVRR
jgi:uncharacterized protein YdeI (YjbR/CyaY-like superfamily)